MGCNEESQGPSGLGGYRSNSILNEYPLGKCLFRTHTSPSILLASVLTLPVEVTFILL